MRGIQRAVEQIGLAGIGNAFTPTISAQAVHKWTKPGVQVPEDRCPAIEHATGGAVPCEELRPDVAWVRVPDPDWPHPQGKPLVDHTTKVSPAGTADEKEAA